MIDRNEEAVTEFVNRTATYFAACELKQHQHAEAGTHDEMPSRICMQMLNTRYDAPFVLDGHWEDRSSQTSATAFTSGYGRAMDHGREEKPPVFLANKKVTLTTPGRHLVSIAFLEDADNPERTRFKIIALKSC
jgi:hypothetical protein